MLVAPVPALNGATPHWTCTTAASTGRAPLQVLDAPTPFGAPIEVAVTASSVQGPPRPARRPQGGESGERVTQHEGTPPPDDGTRPPRASDAREESVLAARSHRRAREESDLRGSARPQKLGTQLRHLFRERH